MILRRELHMQPPPSSDREAQQGPEASVMKTTNQKCLSWKVDLAGRIARIVSVVSALGSFILCIFIWTFSPNTFIAVSLTSLTCFDIQILCLLCNVSGFILLGVDKLFRTDFCSLLSLFSCWLFDNFGKVKHGYEIHGEENIPKHTGALIVYYHNLVPYDLLYLMSKYYLKHRKPIYGIVHRDLERNAPGVCKIMHFFSDREKLMKKLKQGEICSVAPGGGFEAIFSQNYQLLWNGRVGFAAVAKECGVPIVPMFTANGEQSMPIKLFCRNFFEKLHEKTRQIFYLPLFAVPVKLRVHLGQPIYCRPQETPVEFAKRVEDAIYALKNTCQARDASIWSALMERFGYSFSKTTDPYTKGL